CRARVAWLVHVRSDDGEISRTMSHSFRHTDNDTHVAITISGRVLSWRQRVTRGLRQLLGQRYGIALLAGFLGSLTALLVMGALRLWWGTLTPPELVGERLLPLIPADQFVALLARFKPNPKT